MPGPFRTLHALVRHTCDTVAEVLDIYRARNDGVPLTIMPLVLGDVKNLLVALEQYEKHIQQSPLSTLGAASYPQESTQIILDNCGKLSKKLVARIQRDALRDSADTRNEIVSLREAVANLLLAEQAEDEDRYLDSLPPVPGASINPNNGGRAAQNGIFGSRTEVTRSPGPELQETLSHNKETFEAHDLRYRLESLIKERDEFKRRLVISEANNQSKLHHIKQLHAAVTGLGMRHNMIHRLNAWEDLTEELPYLLDRIKSINEVLKDLEPNPRPGSSSLAGQSCDPGGRSEPGSPRDRNSNLQSTHNLALRSPSPTESHASTNTNAAPRVRKSHHSKKKSDERGFWNR